MAMLFLIEKRRYTRCGAVLHVGVLLFKLFLAALPRHTTIHTQYRRTCMHARKRWNEASLSHTWTSLFVLSSFWGWPTFHLVLLFSYSKQFFSLTHILWSIIASEHESKPLGCPFLLWIWVVNYLHLMFTWTAFQNYGARMIWCHNLFLCYWFNG